MRVLIADDDLILRHSLRTHLERWSYDVVECADGVQAWAALQDEKTPSLAIFDWNMPGRDGPSLCRDLRQIPTPPYFAPYQVPNPFFGTGNGFAPPRRLQLAISASF